MDVTLAIRVYGYGRLQIKSYALRGYLGTFSAPSALAISRSRLCSQLRIPRQLAHRGSSALGVIRLTRSGHCPRAIFSRAGGSSRRHT